MKLKAVTKSSISAVPFSRIECTGKMDLKFYCKNNPLKILKQIKSALILPASTHTLSVKPSISSISQTDRVFTEYPWKTGPIHFSK